jgi:hypothetical protein
MFFASMPGRRLSLAITTCPASQGEPRWPETSQDIIDFAFSCGRGTVASIWVSLAHPVFESSSVLVRLADSVPRTLPKLALDVVS